MIKIYNPMFYNLKKTSLHLTKTLKNTEIIALIKKHKPSSQ